MTKKRKKTLLLIDGHYHFFRFYNGIPRAATLQDGTRVNAVFGFVAMLRRLLERFEGSPMLVAFDSETGITEKRNENPEYKKGRAPTEDSMFDQLEILKILLDDTGIPWVEDPGREGDDVICSLAHGFYDRYDRIYVVSNDRDFYQVVDHKIHLLREYNGKMDFLDRDWIKDKLGIYPCQYPLYLALVGDKSDNIKGVQGIGPGWAPRIIGDYSTIQEVVGEPQRLPSRFRAILLDEQRSIQETMNFLVMKKDIPLLKGIGKGDLPGVKKDPFKNTIALLKRNGFG